MRSKKTIKRKYVAMPGSRISVGLAQAAGQVIDSILRENGSVKPEQLLQVARAKTSPIHNYFTWDDAAAAQKQRLSEAASLIRSVRVVIDGMPAAEQPVVRYLHSVEATNGETRFTGSAYIALPELRSNPEYRRQVLQGALGELNSFKRKYADLDLELKSVFRAVKKLEKTLTESL
jgi:chorismate mutase